MDPLLIDALARWLHIAGMMIWVGHNWVNVVHNPTYRGVLPADPPEVAREVFIAASKREHGIFRHSSLIVWATGVFMLWSRGVLYDALTLSPSARTLGLGVWLGTLMVLNLWLVMWPHQKKVLGFVAACTEERLRCSRVTFYASRMNTLLSVPTIFLMICGAHGVDLFG
jgi:uncharacterized membrane protein